ncbi:hypothetical protein [Actinoalloteichus sp. GBA129-24]|nr:hypothetical protein [Actinoalloteichus sp. GBA129-24]
MVRSAVCLPAVAGPATRPDGRVQAAQNSLDAALLIRHHGVEYSQ